MALGSERNNGDNNRRGYDPQYYSPVRIRNYDDHSAITISYSSGLMKVSIAKEGENHRFDEDMITISLTPKKAAVLADQMSKVEAGNVKEAYGTVVGMSEVQTAAALQIKDDIKYFRIAKVDASGRIQSQKTFAFPKNADAGMIWSDFDSMKYTKVYNDEIDYNMFKNALIDFSRSMTGGFGYAGLYMDRYNRGSIDTRLNAALKALGVNIENNRRSFSGGGYFNNGDSSNATSNHKSYSDIESMISDDDE